MTTNLEKPPVWFWVVSIAALLWNLLGVGAYLSDAFMSVEDLGKMTQDYRSLYESRPAWVTGAYAIAVWAGALGCIGLLMRKKWARTLLLISLIGILAQQVYQFFMSNTFEVLGSEAMLLPGMVTVIGILLVLFAKRAEKKGYIG